MSNLDDDILPFISFGACRIFLSFFWVGSSNQDAGGAVRRGSFQLKSLWTETDILAWVEKSVLLDALYMRRC